MQRKEEGRGVEGLPSCLARICLVAHAPCSAACFSFGWGGMTRDCCFFLGASASCSCRRQMSPKISILQHSKRSLSPRAERTWHCPRLGRGPPVSIPQIPFFLQVFINAFSSVPTTTHRSTGWRMHQYRLFDHFPKPWGGNSFRSSTPPPYPFNNSRS